MGNNAAKLPPVASNKPIEPQPNASDGPKVQQRAHDPGEGIRSMKTSGVFRALNFELYAKPNKPTMIIGSVAIFICVGYITYMNLTWDRSKYYTAEAEDGTLYLRTKTSRWDS